MFEIVEDLAKGVHDLQFAPCSSALHAATVGDPTHRNCRDNLTQAVAPPRGPHGRASGAAFGCGQWRSRHFEGALTLAPLGCLITHENADSYRPWSERVPYVPLREGLE